MDVKSWAFETSWGPDNRFRGRTLIKVVKLNGEEAELKIPVVDKIKFQRGKLVGAEMGFGREDLSGIEAFFGSEFPLTRKGIKLLPARRGPMRRGFIIE